MQISSTDSDYVCQFLCRLSEISAQNQPWKSLLDEMLNASRTIFVVDNLAIYLTDTNASHLDVVYARSFGRGKSGEADVSWGESIANQVTQQHQQVWDEPSSISAENRLNSPLTLGIPLNPFEEIHGALILIRFGGPHFTAKEIEYVHFLSHQIENILLKKIMVEYSQKVHSQSDKSELQQNFISTISHELRNPLGFIKGYTTTLLREDTQWDSNTQKEFLRIIERESNHLQSLIDNLLDSSRLQSGQMSFDNQVVRLDSLIRDEASRAQINHSDLVFHLDFDSTVQPVWGDPNRLAQVIDNLITNSEKYAPGAEIFISLRQQGEKVLIDFRDTGPGISEKYIGSLFQRFFRDPEQSIKVHGSGLGLSICKEIIERQSGKIEASLPAGWGLTFTITLPIHHQSQITPLITE
jgi:signal transduction histidine kinase